MAYYINNEEVSQYYFQEALLEAIKEYPTEDFDEFLDEINEPIKIMGITYDVSFVLQQVDPIAYDIAMNEYFDYLFDNHLYELEMGNELTINDITFSTIEPETLSYDETIEVMRQYGEKMYKFFYEADELFAGYNTKKVLKELKANPFVDELQLLDKKAKADYMNNKFKPYFKGECS